MLVRRRMEDRAGPVAVEDPGKLRRILDVGDHRMDWQVREVLVQLLLDPEDRILAVTQQDQAGRLQAAELAAQLRTDGAARTGDQHGPLRGQSLQLPQVDLHRLPPQQVLDFHLAEGEGIESSREDIGDPGQGAHRDARCGGRVDQVTEHSARSGRHRDQQLGDVILAADAGRVRQAAEDREAGQFVILFRGIVVHEAHRLQAEGAIGMQLAEEHDPGGPGAGNQHRAGLEVGIVVLVPAEGAHQQPREGDRRSGEQGVDDQDR